MSVHVNIKPTSFKNETAVLAGKGKKTIGDTQILFYAMKAGQRGESRGHQLGCYDFTLTYHPWVQVLR